VRGRGDRTGEQRLRSLLTALPAWRVREARLALAGQLEARGEAPDLVAALRAHNSALLRKNSLFAFARALRLRSDIWNPANKEQRSLKRARHEPLAPLPRPPADALLQQLLAPHAVALPALDGAIATILRPALPLTCNGWAGPRAAAHALSLSALGNGWTGDRLAEALRIQEVLPAFDAACGVRQATVHAWQAGLAAGALPEAQTLPAWRALRGEEGPAEALLRSLGALVAGGHAERARNHATALAAQGGVLAPGQAVWFEEMDQAIVASMAWVARAQTLLAPFRPASLPLYLSASAALITLVRAYVAMAHQGFTARAAWLQRQGSLPNPSAAAIQASFPLLRPVEAAIAQAGQGEGLEGLGPAQKGEQEWDEDVLAAAAEFFPEAEC